MSNLAIKGEVESRHDTSAVIIGPVGSPGFPDSRRIGWAFWAGLVVALEAWVVAWYGTTFASMADIWWRSETFAHGLIVYPMAGWLIWRKRHELSRTSPRPSLFALVMLFGAGLGWLFSNAGGVQAGEHFFLVALIALVPWALLGTAVARTIAFPLLFTVFAAPIGEFLMPLMMQQTADFTIAALRLSGIPVYREGLHFVIPSGRWSVVEACSGLRYLIASVMLGCLFAYITYRSIWRRLAFVAFSVATPIAANWLRAYMIVMIGHLSDNKLAAGVDHLIYGWVFFGAVMLVMFRVGMIWRDDSHPQSDVALGSRTNGELAMPDGRAIAMTLIIAAAAASLPHYSMILDEADRPRAVKLQAPEGAGGWQRVAGAAAPFKPRYSGSRAQILETYVSEGVQTFLFVGYYASQSDGHELINFNNTIVPSSDREWQKAGERRTEVIPGAINGQETQLTRPGQQLNVWHWYWVAGRWTGSREEAKLLHAFARLAGRGDDAAIVAVYTPRDSSERDRSAERLREFASVMMPILEGELVRAKSASRSTASLAESGVTVLDRAVQ